MGQYRTVSRSTPLTGDEIETIYDIIAHAVDATNFEGKSTDEIFGEIFTRFRTEIGLYDRHDNLKMFLCNLKSLNYHNENNRIINSIINELYQRKFDRTMGVDDIELSAVALQGCLSDVKDVNKESEIVLSSLDKINKEYLEEANV